MARKKSHISFVHPALISCQSLVIPLLEYCCQLWNPCKAKDTQAIETIQQTFTYKITEVQNFNY